MAVNNCANSVAAPQRIVAVERKKFVPRSELQFAETIDEHRSGGAVSSSERRRGGVQIEGFSIKMWCFKNPRIAAEPDWQGVRKIRRGNRQTLDFKGASAPREIKNSVLHSSPGAQGKRIATNLTVFCDSSHSPGNYKKVTSTAQTMSEYLLPEIETARLRLRLYDASDAADVHAIWLDKDVSRYFSPINQERTEPQVLETLLRTHVRWRTRGYSQWGVTLKSADDAAAKNPVIGYCGFQPLEESGEVELYYGFPSRYWGQGLATEAARAALRFAFETAALPRVAAVTHPDNKSSHRVLEKIGMRFEGRKFFYGVDVFYFAASAQEHRRGTDFYRLHLNEPQH